MRRCGLSFFLLCLVSSSPMLVSGALRGTGSRALEDAPPPPQDNNNAPQAQDAAPQEADIAPKAEDAAPKKAEDAAPKAPPAGAAKAGTAFTIGNNNPNVVADGNTFKLSVKPDADTAKILGGEAYNGGTVAFTAKSAAAMPGVVTSVYLTSAKGEDGEATKDQISFDFLGKSPKTVQTTLVIGGENKPKEVELEGDSSAAEHKYSVVWDEKGVSWFVDGKEVRAEALDKPLKPMYLNTVVFTTTNGMDGVKAWAGETDWAARNNEAITAKIDFTTLPKAGADAADAKKTPKDAAAAAGAKKAPKDDQVDTKKPKADEEEDAKVDTKKPQADAEENGKGDTKKPVEEADEKEPKKPQGDDDDDTKTNAQPKTPKVDKKKPKAAAAAGGEEEEGAGDDSIKFGNEPPASAEEVKTKKHHKSKRPKHTVPAPQADGDEEVDIDVSSTSDNGKGRSDDTAAAAAEPDAPTIGGGDEAPAGTSKGLKKTKTKSA